MVIFAESRYFGYAVRAVLGIMGISNIDAYPICLDCSISDATKGVANKVLLPGDKCHQCKLRRRDLLKMMSPVAFETPMYLAEPGLSW